MSSSSSSFSEGFWAFSCSDELFTLHGTAITTRHVALLIVTWMLARIAEVVHNILLATQETGAKDAAAASMPVQVGEPTFKAGGSVPMKPEGSQVGHSWTPMEAKNFRVRCGPNYKKNGLKAPSGPALGKVEAMDVFITERRIRHCLSLGHIALPPATPGWSEVYPEFLVITQMLPVHFNSALVAGKGADGETYVLITYVRMPPNLGAGYRSDDEPQNAEQLLKRCAAHPGRAPRLPRPRPPCALAALRSRVPAPGVQPTLLRPAPQVPDARRPGPGRGALLEDDRRGAQPARDRAAAARLDHAAADQIQRQAGALATAA